MDGWVLALDNQLISVHTLHAMHCGWCTDLKEERGHKRGHTLTGCSTFAAVGHEVVHALSLTVGSCGHGVS